MELPVAVVVREEGSAKEEKLSPVNDNEKVAEEFNSKLNCDSFVDWIIISQLQALLICPRPDPATEFDTPAKRNVSECTDK